MEMKEELEDMDMKDDLLEFTLAENIEMEKLFKEMKDNSTSQEFFQELADKFSCSAHRYGKSPMKWEQIRSWFQDKQLNLKAKVMPSSLPKETCAFPSTALVNRRAKVSNLSVSEAALELPNLMFEARSAKDYAWFDVARFLNYKVFYSGELMVRVRFAGFDKEEDEWVSVETALRERSIPLIPSECDTVKVGDLVLCYKENEDHALYSDAYVMGIDRKLHDNNDCGCVFVVRYEYDNSEEKVGLLRLCRRPTKSLSMENKEMIML